MFIQIITSILIGILAGTITGLIPGLHINLVAIFLVAVAPFLFQYISPVFVVIFILAMSITHTFLDAIPGVYFGAPDESQALGVLPGHRMLLRGEGHNALKLTLIGSFFSVIFGILSFFLFVRLVEKIYPIVEGIIAYILILLVIYIISRESGWKKRTKALLVILLSGTLGICVFYLNGLGVIQQPLLPMLSGLFGLSILLTSLNEGGEIPIQNLNAKLNLEKGVIKKTTFASLGVGFIAAFLPGFGSSQAAILAKEVIGFFGDVGEKGFMVLVGGLNTANMLISLATFFVLEKARNGSVLAIKNLIGQIDFPFLILILACLLVVAGIATFIALFISKKFSILISKVDYKKIVIGISIFIFLMCFAFSGFTGLVVLFVSIALGIFCNYLGVGKNYLTGCLLIPVILNFML